ncbi:hypothetical protein KAU32_03370 [bacterium]|nr:hypothetical protein [bacterium]
MLVVVGLVLFAGCSEKIQTPLFSSENSSKYSVSNENYSFIEYGDQFYWNYEQFYSIEHNSLNCFLHFIESGKDSVEFKNSGVSHAWINKLNVVRKMVISKNYHGAREKLNRDLMQFVDNVVINQIKRDNIIALLEITDFMLQKYGSNEIRVMPLHEELWTGNIRITPIRVMEKNNIFYIEFSEDVKKLYAMNPGPPGYVDGTQIGSTCFGIAFDCTNKLLVIPPRPISPEIVEVSSRSSGEKSLYEILKEKDTFFEETEEMLIFKASRGIDDPSVFSEDKNGDSRMGISKNWINKQY